MHRERDGGLTASLLAPIHALSRYSSGFAHIAIVCLTLTACAAPRAYHREYAMALSNAIIEGGQEHLKRGEAFERAGNLQLAYEEYRAAFAQDPFLDSALLKRELVRLKILAAAVPLDRAAAAIVSRPAPPASNEPIRQSSLPSATILLDPMDLVVPAGEELSVRVVASRAIAGARLDVTFDPSLLSVVRVEPSSGATAEFQALTRDGATAVSFSGASPTDGLICTMVLKADAPGSSVLRVVNARASDGHGNPLPLESLSASVRIPGPEDGSI